MAGTSFLASKSGKRILGLLYGIGAAVVIVGAWGKILHFSWASYALTAGLLTEAVIFFVSAFEPPHMEPDWTLVYPELAGLKTTKPKQQQGVGATAMLDKALEDAKIGPELFQSLGNGMKSLGDTANKLAKLGDVNGVTEEYVSNIKGASSAFKELSISYTKASASLTGIANDPQSVNYGAALQEAAKKLQALNTAYESQIKSATDFGQNLSKLNQVYGNMLGAMTLK